MPPLPTAPEMLAHTFFLEKVLRLVVPDIPEDARMLTYRMAPNTAEPLAPDAAERWRDVFSGTHRSLSAFNAACREKVRVRDLPRSLQSVKAKTGKQRRFFEVLYLYYEATNSRAVEIRWTAKSGIGVYARQTINKHHDLGVLTGRHVRTDQSLEDALKAKGQAFSLVDRTFYDKRNKARNQVTVCVGPLALLNSACEKHTNVHHFRTEQGERQEPTVWKHPELAAGPIPRGQELLVYYGDYYTLPCLLCPRPRPETAAAPAPTPEEEEAP
jgi:hypothetical protein